MSTVVTGETAVRKRGCLSTVGRVLKWIIIALVVLLLLGVVYQAVAVEPLTLSPVES